MRLVLERSYQETAFDQSKLMSKLPATMQDEVHEHIYKSMVDMMPLFQNVRDTEDSALKKLMVSFKPMIMQPFEPIYLEQSHAFDFYVIISGEVTLSRRDGRYSRVLKPGKLQTSSLLFDCICIG